MGTKRRSARESPQRQARSSSLRLFGIGMSATQGVWERDVYSLSIFDATTFSLFFVRMACACVLKSNVHVCLSAYR